MPGPFLPSLPDAKKRGKVQLEKTTDIEWSATIFENVWVYATFLPFGNPARAVPSTVTLEMRRLLFGVIVNETLSPSFATTFLFGTMDPGPERETVMVWVADRTVI
jgi:hypothetical protein